MSKFNKKMSLLSLGLLWLVLLIAPGSRPRVSEATELPDMTPQTLGLKSLGSPDLLIIENRGQVEPDFAYHIRRPQGNVFFGQDRIVYQFLRNEPANLDGSKSGPTRYEPTSSEPSGRAHRDLALPYIVDRPYRELDSPCHENAVRIENLQIEFPGANPDVRLEAEEPLATKVHFYEGRDSGSWLEDIPSFRSLIYRNLYPHIDLHIIQADGVIKHEFHVRPGGNPEHIALRYGGVEDLRLDEQGRLELHTASRILLEDAPVSYQLINGNNCPVDSGYVIRPDGNAAYVLGPYREDAELVIDPSLLYSTFLGGSQVDFGRGVVVDLGLNAYVVGYTQSTNFPKTPGAYDKVKNNTEAFIVKLDPTGSTLLYATYFGGSERDWGESIAFSWGDESVVIVGDTNSDDLPTTPGAFDRTLDGKSDLFVAKFDPSGHLTFSTYFGGSSADGKGKVAADGSGNVFLAGLTNSQDLDITPGVVDSTFDMWPNQNFNPINLFVAKFSSTGKVLEYCTFYGTYDMELSGIAVDYEGYAFVTGTAHICCFPTTEGAYSLGEHEEDGYIFKLNPVGTAVEYATFIGLGEMDVDDVVVSDIDLDGKGNAFITGTCYLENGASFCGDCAVAGYVLKFNSIGSQRLFNFFFSGGYHRNAGGVALDGRGAVYMLADTDVKGLETSDDAFQDDLAGKHDLYIAKLDASSGDMIYAIYLGGSGLEWGTGIAADSYGSIYVTGFTGSFDFPTTPGAYDRVYSGNGDAFVARLRDSEAAGKLSLSRENMKFKFAQGATDTRTKGLRVANQGTGKVAYQIAASPAWVSVSPVSGEIKTEKDLVKVTVDPTKLKSGLHKGVVTVASVDAYNSPQTLAVFLRIKGPRIKLKQEQYAFTGVAGETDPAPQVCRIRNSGSGELRYKISSQDPWLSTDRRRGKSTGKWDDFEIRVDTSGLSPGIYQGTILITSKDTVDTAEITVNLNLQAPDNIE